MRTFGFPGSLGFVCLKGFQLTVGKVDDLSGVYKSNGNSTVLDGYFFFVIPGCVAKVPVSLWGCGWGLSCVRHTLRNRPQPSAWGPYGRAYGKFCKRGHSWSFPALHSFISRGRRGTSWHSNMFHDVSKVVLCGRRNAFATFSEEEDALYFSWRAQHLGHLRCHFAWQAKHIRRDVLRDFCESHCQRCAKWWHSQLHTLHFTLHTLHSAISIPHFTLYTLHCTLSTLHSTLHTCHFTLHTLHSTLQTLYFTPHTFHSTLYTLHLTLYTPHYTLYTPHSTLYTPHITLPTPNFTLYTPHFTLHTLHHFTLYTTHFTLHTLHLTLYTLHLTLLTPTLYTLHSHSTLSALYPPHFALHITLHTLYFTLFYTPHFTLYTLHCTLHTLNVSLNTSHFPLYTLHWTLYTPHSTLSTPHSTLPFSSPITTIPGFVILRVGIRVRGLHLVFCGAVLVARTHAAYTRKRKIWNQKATAELHTIVIGDIFFGTGTSTCQ